MNRAATIAFLNHKGGVGKTTTVANVGAGLALMGQRVLLVDLDPQGHLTRFLGIDPADIRRTVYDVLRGDVAPWDAIVGRPMGARLHVDGQDTRIGVSLLPASINFSEAEVVLSRRATPEFLLRDEIEKVSDGYDYILIDCSPSLGLISTNALATARTVFIPVQTEYLAMESLESLMSRIENVSSGINPSLQIGGLIATRFDARKVLSRRVLQTLRQRFGPIVLDAMIRDNIALAESPRVGKDIFSYRSRSFGAEDYLALTNEIMDRVATIDETEPGPEEYGAFESHVG